MELNRFTFFFSTNAITLKNDYWLKFFTSNGNEEWLTEAWCTIKEQSRINDHETFLKVLTIETINLLSMSCFLHIIFTFFPFYRFRSQCLLLEPQMEQLQCRKERTPQNPYDRMHDHVSKEKMEHLSNIKYH